MFRALLNAVAIVALLLVSACTGTAGPLQEPPATSFSGPPLVSGALQVPARVGLLRLTDGQPGPVPSAEYARWRGAITEVNRALAYPIRLMPMTPGSTPVTAEQLPGLAAAAGLDAVLVYELAVAVSDDHMAAGLTALPMLGGVIPVSTTTRANGLGVARLYGIDAVAPLASAETRMQDAAISSVRQSGGSGERMQALAEYALLHRLMPAAEDMIVGSVAAGL